MVVFKSKYIELNLTIDLSLASWRVGIGTANGHCRAALIVVGGRRKMVRYNLLFD